MTTVNFNEFSKIEIRMGKIVSAEKVEGSDKLLKLEVDFGIAALQPQIDADKTQTNAEKRVVRQIIAGIGKFYEPEKLVGKECPFVFNLETKVIAGLESQGMILCAGDKGPILLHPDKEVLPGSAVK